MADKKPVAAAAPTAAAAPESNAATALMQVWQDTPAWPAMQIWTQALDYVVDSAQRATLYWDVMRQRGNQYFEHQAEIVPNVLTFKFEVIMNGLHLPRPVNYGLVKVIPKDGVEIDETKRPFV